MPCPDAEMLESGGGGSGPVAEGIVTHVKNLLRRDIEGITHPGEKAWVRLGEAIFTRKEKGFEGSEQVNVGEDAAEAGVEVGEHDTAMPASHCLDDVLGIRQGEPGPGLLKVPVKRVEKLVKEFISVNGASSFVKDFANKASPPVPFAGIRGVPVFRERGWRALPDRPEGCVQGYRVSRDSVAPGYSGVGNTHFFGQVDEGSGGIEADGPDFRAFRDLHF